jgi:hypothetical protein
MDPRRGARRIEGQDQRAAIGRAEIGNGHEGPIAARCRARVMVPPLQARATSAAPPVGATTRVPLAIVQSAPPIAGCAKANKIAPNSIPVAGKVNVSVRLTAPNPIAGRDPRHIDAIWTMPGGRI